MKPSACFFLAASLLLPSLSTALTFECSHIRVKGKKYNFEKIGGPHTVSVIEHSPPSIHNTTWAVDLCGTLKKDKEVPAGDQCPSGSYVCGVKTTFNRNDDDKPHVDEVIPIAGSFATSTGTNLDPIIERLEDISGSDMTGLRLELHGGTYMKQKQVAIIDLQCDPERTGNEKSPVKKKKGKDDEDDKVRNAESDEGNDSADDDDDDDDDNNSLRFVSYKKEEDHQVLRLDWRTKYACTTYEEDDDSGSGKEGTSKHWGFFTWFIVLLFLGIAAYLIFGSWLNYNRYGARGWDLLPHGDTIRDIPYLFKDWSRKVVSTVSGGGSRGGYSAV
ncbi:hypothetical protein EPUS_02345 [Endocarpon pusillum Z07020]|uniref:Autophagy-related protein 27 n=1 Tax=Endocarpon pusillum (strain Z07020 / HMAS-L-300199) TaxID=1263415 RepID=U1GFE2_ENDPU|nr:uncharacterized protein EPUS_02345 [Endocarpon pusillum Z07020]ERF70823.1 hypothetical protein EPUS_02345 [Endocarpon pusillum Z07020]